MKLHTNKSLLIFCLPALVFYMIFMVIPAISGLGYSFTDWNGLYKDFNFVGISNYIEALKDKNFLNTVGISFKYVVAMVVIQNFFGLLIAVLIDSRKKQGAWRTIIFLPNMISLITSSFIWYFIFTKVFPEIAKTTILKFFNKSWLGDPTFAFWSIVIVAVWAGVGYTMIIYLAALQGVPSTYKEAARIDGANSFQVFWFVVLPSITHAVTINVFLTLNGSFKAFDHVFGLTSGGPGRATELITLNIYNEAFSSNFRFGFANSKAVILFLLVLVITVIQFKVMGTGGEKDGKKAK